MKMGKKTLKDTKSDVCRNNRMVEPEKRSQRSICKHLLTGKISQEESSLQVAPLSCLITDLKQDAPMLSSSPALAHLTNLLLTQSFAYIVGSFTDERSRNEH